MAMASDVVAEHDDDIGIERIGPFDDRLDTIQRHPGIAGMEVRDDGDPELEIGGPLRRLNGVPRDAKPQLGLAEPVCCGRNAGNAETGEEAKKIAT
jgi:hypothetical protein